MIATMGIDLSLTSTGVSVGHQTSIVSSKHKGAMRLSEISKQILDIAQSLKVQIIAIEGYSFASRNSQAHSIGELGGCVRMRLWENQIPFIEIPPTCRAKFATGKGNSSKSEVVSCVSAKTGLVFAGSGADDMCDAFVLEEMLLTKMGISKFVWPQQSLEAFKKIDWSGLENLIEP